MSLLAQGFRFLVLAGDTDVKTNWTHPAEAPQMIAAGWVDATDMGDDEYDALIEGG